MVNGADVGRATYLSLDSTKNVDSSWDINVSFIIHVNFDHVWTEHYPVTLSACEGEICHFKKAPKRRLYWKLEKWKALDVHCIESRQGVAKQSGG